MSSSTSKLIHFGKFEVTDQVFYKSKLCYALVNIKPILQGHVLVIPYRAVPRHTDLSVEEITDVFATVQKVQRMLARVYFKSSQSSQNQEEKTSKEEGGREGSVEGGSFNIAIQDGRLAGQTVEHMHCHVIPRMEGDNKVKGDEVYDILQGEEGNVGGGLWDREKSGEIGKGGEERPIQREKFPKIEESGRKERSDEDMNREAAMYREKMAEIDGEGR